MFIACADHDDEGVVGGGSVGGVVPAGRPFVAGRGYHDYPGAPQDLDGGVDAGVVIGVFDGGVEGEVDNPDVCGEIFSVGVGIEILDANFSGHLFWGYPLKEIGDDIGDKTAIDFKVVNLQIFKVGKRTQAGTKIIE